jgi:hypothetical protein
LPSISLFGTLALAQGLAAFLLAEPEGPGSPLNGTPLRHAGSSSILFEVDRHYHLPDQFSGTAIRSPALLDVMDLVPKQKRSRANLLGANDSPRAI